MESETTNLNIEGVIESNDQAFSQVGMVSNYHHTNFIILYDFFAFIL